MRNAAEANYLASWRLLARAAVGGEVVEDDDLLLIAIPAPISVFNTAFVKAPGRPEQFVDRVRAFYAERGVPCTLRAREADLGGFEDVETSPVMVVPTDQVAPPPEGLDIRIVSDPLLLETHRETMALGFGMPADVLTTVFTPAVLAVADYVGFVAFEGETPVSTGALCITDDVAGIYNIATPEPFRRRGLGAAVTRRAVAEGARRGCKLATLQSSEMGYSVYEQMGFRTVTTWGVAPVA